MQHPGNRPDCRVYAGPGNLILSMRFIRHGRRFCLKTWNVWEQNALVTNESPEKLTKVLKNILIESGGYPCSGEGMFRKNDAACSEWSVRNVNLCGSERDGILDCAAGMLSPGGRIVYSTCTFAPVENEGSISRFIQRHPEFHIVSVEKKPGMSEGVSKWWDNPCENLEDTIRLWPHKLHGEGHSLTV